MTICMEHQWMRMEMMVCMFVLLSASWRQWILLNCAAILYVADMPCSPTNLCQGEKIHEKSYNLWSSGYSAKLLIKSFHFDSQFSWVLINCSKHFAIIHWSIFWQYTSHLGDSLTEIAQILHFSIPPVNKPASLVYSFQLITPEDFHSNEAEISGSSMQSSTSFLFNTTQLHIYVPASTALSLPHGSSCYRSCSSCSISWQLQLDTAIKHKLVNIVKYLRNGLKPSKLRFQL